MATDLTGLKVKDTYNSLLKIGDNSDLSATAKVISDGEGHETILYLSTNRVGIGVSPVSGYDLTINSATRTGSIDIIGAATAASLQLTGGSNDQGTMSWNTDEETVDIIQNGATLQVGQEIHVHVKNQTGSTITDGTPVYVTGTLGASGRLTVAPMIADGTIEAKYFLGITTEDIPNGEDGKVTTFGKIRGLDTSSYSEGQTLYVSASTAGAFQTTAPVAPNLDLEVAIVINSHANNGTIFVRATNGQYLGLLHDVYLNGVSDKDLLVYDNANSRWSNSKTIGDLSAGNLTLSGYLRGAGNFVIDPSPYSDDAGVVQILGDLRVDGETTTINSTTVTIDDKNLVLASGSATAADANGAGITIDGADATMTYNSTSDRFDFNKDVKTSGYYFADTHFRSTDTAATLSTNGAGIVYLRPNAWNSTTGQFRVFDDGTVDSSGDITAPNFIGDLTGNADTATTLETARNIAVDGAVTGNADFDGSGDITITTSVNHNHDADYVNVTGDRMTGNLKFNDSVKAQFGTDNDFRIQHNDTHAFLDNYKGAIFIRNTADDSDIILSSDDGSGSITQYLRVDGSEGSVILYHYGSAKLETTSTGVSVTGALSGNIDTSSISGGTIDINGTTAINLQYNGTTQLRIDSTGVDYLGTVSFSNDGITLTDEDSTIDSFFHANVDYTALYTVTSNARYGADYIQVDGLDSRSNTRFTISPKDISSPDPYAYLYIGGNNSNTAPNTLVDWHTIEMNALLVKLYANLNIQSGSLLVGGVTVINSSRDITANSFSGDGSSLTNVPTVSDLQDVTNNGASTTNSITVNGLTSNDDITTTGNLFIGTVGQQNWIAFSGTTGDGGSTSTYTTTYIGERIYGGTERSELIIYKGNDGHASTASPDRIRMIGANLCFDTYNIAQSYPTDLDGVAALTTTRAMTIDTNQHVSITNGNLAVETGVIKIGTNTVIDASRVGYFDRVVTLSGGSNGVVVHNGGVTASNNYMNFYTAQSSGWSFNANGTGADTDSVLTIGADGSINTSGGLEVSGNSIFDGVAVFKGQASNYDGSTGRTSYWNYDDKVAIALEPAADDGAVAIFFKSIGNAPSDFGYIAFDEDYGEAGVTAGENSALIIGCENDGGGSSDHVRVKGRLVVEADMSSSDPTNAFQVKDGNVTTDLFRVARSGASVFSSTLNVADQLTVDDAIRLTSNPSITGDSSGVYFWNQAGVGATIASNAFQVKTGGNTTALTIDNAQNSVFAGTGTFGDGSQTVNSDADLTIRNGVSFAGIDLKSARTSGNIGGLRYYGTSSDSVPVSQFLVETDGSYHFYNGTNGAEERFRINSNGDIGIGVNPSYKLEVAGQAHIQGILSVSQGQQIRIGGATDGNHFLRKVGTGNSGVTIDGPQLHGHQGGELATNYTGDNWALRWAIGGNVVINNTLTTGGSATFGNYITFTTGTSIPSAAISYHTNGYLYIKGGGSGAAIGDDNFATSVYCIDNGNIEFNTAGTGTKMVITASGSVGIGTTSPSYKLDVNGTSRASQFVSLVNTNRSSVGVRDWLLVGTYDRAGAIEVGDIAGARYAIWGGGYDLKFGKHISTTDTYVNVMQFLAANATDTSVDVAFTSGNVGIGTTSPSKRLEVKTNTTAGQGGTIRVNRGSDRATHQGYIVIESDNYTDEMYLGVPANGSDVTLGARHGNINFATGSYSTRMTITSAGNVGIGTTSPSQKLQVAGTIYTNNGNFKIDSGYELTWGNGNTSILGNTSTNFLDFRVGNTPRMIINSSGNVGIGTTNPTPHSPSRKALIISDTTNNALIEIHGGSGGKTLLQSVAGSAYIAAYGASSGGINFGTGSSGSTKMVINSLGSVGIGTTSPQAKLDVNGTVLLGREHGVTQLHNNKDYNNMASGLVWREYNATGTYAHATSSTTLSDYIKSYNFTEQGIATTVDSFTRSDDTYAVEFVGYYYAITDGLFEFSVSSDDASDLFIDGTRVAHWYGGHGDNNSPTGGSGQTTGSIYLVKGFHRLYARFQEGTGGDSISLWNKVPSGSWDKIGSSRLFHKAEDLFRATGSGNATLYGTFTATADIVAYSDERIKDNIETIDNALDKVNQLRGVSFNRKSDGKESIGVIAQEVEKILPEVVTEDEQGIKGVSYGNIVGVLIEAMKEQQKQIDELKARLDA